MEQLATAIQNVVGRLLDLFDVFDFSFFIAGFATLVAIAWCAFGLGWINADDITFTLLATAGVTLAFTSGLISFGFGRATRRVVVGPWTTPARHGRRSLLGWRLQNRGELLRATLLAHDLQQADLLDEYVDPSWTLREAEAGRPALEAMDTRRLEALYTRLWAEARQDESLKPSFEIVRGQWIRAAIYDGLSTSIFAWIIAITLVVHFGATDAARVATSAPLDPWPLSIAAAIVGWMGILACWNEARRCDLYQVDELVATVAWRRQERRRLSLERELGPSTQVTERVLEAIADELSRVPLGQHASALVTEALGELTDLDSLPVDAHLRANMAVQRAWSARIRREVLERTRKDVDPSTWLLATGSHDAMRLLLQTVRLTIVEVVEESLELEDPEATGLARAVAGVRRRAAGPSLV